MEKKLLTIDQLVEFLNCSKSNVYQLVYRREIPHVKIGHRTLRFNPEEIKEWLQEKSRRVSND